jgi:hypothetical protein
VVVLVVFGEYILRVNEKIYIFYEVKIFFSPKKIFCWLIFLVFILYIKNE